MNHADRIVMTELRRTGKDGAAGLDRHEREPERFHNGRCRQISGHHGFQEPEPVVREQDVSRHYPDPYWLVHGQLRGRMFTSAARPPSPAPTAAAGTTGADREARCRPEIGRAHV